MKAKGTIVYRRQLGTSMWHWHQDCSSWPTGSNVEELREFPSALAEHFCRACRAKDRTAR